MKQDKIDMYLRNGTNYYKDGNYAKAIDYFKKIINSHHDHYGAHFMIGLVYFDFCKYEQAFSHLEFANRYKPNYMTHYYLALLHARNGESKNALYYFNKVLEEKPNLRRVHFNLGKLHHRMKKYNEAIDYYMKAIESSPYYFETYFLLSLTYKKMGDMKKSFEYNKKGLNTLPVLPLIYYEFGLHFEKSLKFNKAAFYFNKLLELQPDHPDAERIKSYFGKFLKKVKEEQNQNSSADPLSFAVFDSNLEKTPVITSDKKKTKEQTKKDVKEVQDNAKALLKLGQKLYNKKELTKAKVVIKRYLKRYPRDSKAYYFLVLILSEENNKPEALKYLAKLIKIDPESKAFKNDPALKNIRDTADFKRIME